MACGNFIYTEVIGLLMNETMKKLIDANRRYVSSGRFAGDVSAARRAENEFGQKPCAAVVTCSDSRVIPEAIFSAGIGKLFVIRTAGNVIGDSELASLEYAVEHLRVGTVIVMGHTGCGAVNAALHGEFGGAVGVITNRIKLAAGDETDPYKTCVLNVRHGVGTLRKVFADTGVTISGAIYDILSGKVEIVDADGSEP